MRMINLAISGFSGLKPDCNHTIHILIFVHIKSDLGMDSINIHFKIRKFKVKLHVKMRERLEPKVPIDW